MKSGKRFREERMKNRREKIKKIKQKVLKLASKRDRIRTYK